MASVDLVTRGPSTLKLFPPFVDIQPLSQMKAELDRLSSGTSAGSGSETGARNAASGGSKNTPENTKQIQVVSVVPSHLRKTGSTLIYTYISSGDIERAKTWLDDGNDPNVPGRDDYISWPVACAIVANQPEILKLLLEYGALPDPPNRKDQPWFRAVYLSGVTYRSPEMLKMVLDYGAKPDPIASYQHSNSVLDVVNDSPDQNQGVYSVENQVKILKLLLEHGANPLQKDDRGVTALSSAERLNRQDLVDIIEKSLNRAVTNSKR